MLPMSTTAATTTTTTTAHRSKQTIETAVFSGASDLSLESESSSLLSSSSTALSEGGVAENVAGSPAVAREDEPNLYAIPQGISAIYRPLPVALRCLLGTLSSYVAISSTTSWKYKHWARVARCVSHLPALVMQWWCRADDHVVVGLAISWKKLLAAVIKAVLCYMVTTMIVQEFVPGSRPSRITTEDLSTKYNLPSRLSRYATPTVATLPSSSSSSSSDLTNHRVHWLEYDNASTASAAASAGALGPAATDDDDEPQFDAVYVNHGFGASSLSWLPAIPALAHTCRSPTVLGHDAPGFGFTDRWSSSSTSDDSLQQQLRDDYYSFAHSAAVATSLLQERLEKDKQMNTKSSSSSSNSESPTSVLLLGHSMGSLSTLRMALLLDPTIQQRIILVSPALGLSTPSRKKSRGDPRRARLLLGAALMAPLQRALLGAGQYTLRRLVGRKHFWRNGLRTVWGDPRRLTDSDVLRFQWPSIGQGWERGLLQFTMAQVAGATTATQNGRADSFDTDEELLQAVLDLPNVKSIDVIVATKDRVMPPKRVRAFFKDFPAVTIVEMEGLGHDPFEEDVDSFVETVDSLLQAR